MGQGRVKPWVAFKSEVAATSNARFVEFFLDDQVLNFRRLINHQLEFKDGHVTLRQTPGLGFEFDESAVRTYGGAWSVIRA